MINKAKQRLASILVLLAMVVGMAAPVARAAEDASGQDEDFALAMNMQIATVADLLWLNEQSTQDILDRFRKQLYAKTTVDDLAEWPGDVYEMDGEQFNTFIMAFENAVLTQLGAPESVRLTETCLEDLQEINAWLRQNIADPGATAINGKLWADCLQTCGATKVELSAPAKSKMLYFSTNSRTAGTASSSDGLGAVVAVAGIGAAVIGGGIVAATLFPASALGQAVLQAGESLGLLPADTAAQKLMEAQSAAAVPSAPTAAEAPYADEYVYEIYRANNADLDAAFGDDRTAYLDHWLNNGKAEGRVAK